MLALGDTVEGALALVGDNVVVFSGPGGLLAELTGTSCTAIGTDAVFVTHAASTRSVASSGWNRLARTQPLALSGVLDTVTRIGQDGEHIVIIR